MAIEYDGHNGKDPTTEGNHTPSSIMVARYSLRHCNVLDTMGDVIECFSLLS